MDPTLTKRGISSLLTTDERLRHVPGLRPSAEQLPAAARGILPPLRGRFQALLLQQSQTTRLHVPTGRETSLARRTCPGGRCGHRAHQRIITAVAWAFPGAG